MTTGDPKHHVHVEGRQRAVSAESFSLGADGPATSFSDIGGGGGGGLVEEPTQTASFTASVGSAYPVDASGGSITVTLPASPSDRDAVELTSLDMGGNTVTVGRNGNTIEAAASDDTITATDVTKRYVWYSARDSGAGSWVIK